MNVLTKHPLFIVKLLYVKISPHSKINDILGKKLYFYDSCPIRVINLNPHFLNEEIVMHIYIFRKPYHVIFHIVKGATKHKLTGKDRVQSKLHIKLN